MRRGISSNFDASIYEDRHLDMQIAKILKETEALSDDLIAQRRDFHRHPELGFVEHRTAGIVADFLTDLGFTVRTGVAETGVVGLLEGVSPGPTVLLRFDMDALPIQEETGAPYESLYPGIMHACGHDGHTAVGMAVARLLNADRQELPGAVKFVFQPAEEGLGGAERMIEEGALLDPEPDFALAFHLWNEKPLGWMGITPGPMMAGAEILEIEIIGEGGHGAHPHETVDPVLAAAHVITALQSVVSRNLDPQETGVVSITQVQAGETFNVIPPKVLIKGTIRTFNPEVRERVMGRVEKITEDIAGAMDCHATVKIERLTPPLVNDPEIAAKLQNLATQIFPDTKLDIEQKTMGSEDMAFFVDAIPGCMFFVGSANPERGLDAAHHNPRFDFDERALIRAAALINAATRQLLEGE
jgi:amidohydrolase